MASCLTCLLRTCFETNNTQDEDSDDHYGPPQSNRMIRLFQPTADPAQAAAYRPAEANDPTTTSTEESSDRNEDDVNCCRDNETPDTAGRGNSTSACGDGEDNPHAAGLRMFWRKFKERFNALDLGPDAHRDLADPFPSSKQEEKKLERTPMLTLASSFDSSKEVPTILSNSIIYPGSDLQQEMAKAMSARLEHYDDECVICMDGFTSDNPRMPTLCGCGENKTYFHLPCLYQWIEQSKNCPSCAKRLRWEEF